MGDEVILLGNIKLLQQQKKKLYIVSQNPSYLKNFLSQFIDVADIVFIRELPWGIRSFFSYLFSWKRNELKYFFQIDTIILGGGEMLTEEMPHAYYYRLNSLRPALFFKKELILMGGIQVPKKRYNKLLFHRITKHTKRILSRDLDEIQALKWFWVQNVEFFMDSSYFAIDDWSLYQKKPKSDYIIVNLNSRGTKFFDEILALVKTYLEKGYHIYYAPIARGSDDDLRYYQWFLDAGIPQSKISLLEWEPDFKHFLSILSGAKQVIWTRLHLFLISSFLEVPVKVFPYQKKILKMQKIITTLTWW